MIVYYHDDPDGRAAASCAVQAPARQDSSAMSCHLKENDVKQSDEVKARNAAIATAYKAAHVAHMKMERAIARHAKTIAADRAAEQQHKVAVDVYREARAALDELTDRAEAPALANE